MEYKVIHSASLDVFEKKVNEALSNGFIFLSGARYRNYEYDREMVKIGREEKLEDYFAFMEKDGE